jgi:hypothetical protein
MALKKKFFKIALLSETFENSIMLTKCYFNKTKYRTVYQPEIEKKIKKIENMF